jgi:CrcB protein
MTSMTDAPAWAAVAAGGIVGALLRWALLRAATRIDPSWATLAANLLACALLGAAGSMSASTGPNAGRLAEAMAAFWTAGLCGSLSTFSTLCADAFRQARSVPRRRLLVYLTAHLLGGPLAHRLGSMVGG